MQTDDITNQIKNLQSDIDRKHREIERFKVFEAHNLPLPRHFSSETIASYRVMDLTEAKTLLEKFWPFHISGSMWKSQSFRAYFNHKPYDDRHDEQETDVDLYAECAVYNHTIDYKLETFIQIDKEVFCIWIDIEKIPVRVDRKDIHFGKTARSGIKERQLSFYGLETGLIPVYSIRKTFEPD